MRHEDALHAESLGAAYLGVIFAPSARRVTLEQAQRVLGERTAHSPKRVGVFAEVTEDEIVRACEALALDVVQLHGASVAHAFDSLQSRLQLQFWNVLHVGVDGITAAVARADTMRGDATLLDAHVDGMLGGTGTSFDWGAARAGIDTLRSRGPIILAGGLRPENVARAISLVAPNVVDVSSGVEVSPGIKDHVRMRAFRDQVRAADERSGNAG